VIGLDSQRQDGPSTHSTLAVDQFPAACRYWLHQHCLAALGTPDEMIDNQVDAVFVSLILHVEIIACDNREINKYSPNGGLKPGEKPA